MLNHLLPPSLNTDADWARLIEYMKLNGLRLRVLKSEIRIERK